MARPDTSPAVSFCVATFRRSELLARTLEAICRQSYSDFEVIVSDNDPKASAEPVVAAFSDPRLRYVRNKENVGMVKNFNRALSHARGDFVVMITDDDPPYSNLLESLVELRRDYPGFGCYYGACNVFVEAEEIANDYGHQIGLNSCLAPVAEASIRLYSAEAFPRSFFRNQIFPYVLWSTGMVRRDILQQTGGMPDYGSPFLTDFAYIAAVGSHSGMATVNTALGHQTVHLSNFGRAEFRELPIALRGCHDYLVSQLSRRKDWDSLRPEMEDFLGRWMMSHGTFLLRHMAKDPARIRELRLTMREVLRPPYMRRFRSGYYARSYLPARVVAFAGLLSRKTRGAIRCLGRAFASQL